MTTPTCLLHPQQRGTWQTTLNTLVVTEYTIPLQILRARELLARAEELNAKKDRSEAKNVELGSHFAEARSRLEMAKILGYGNKNDYRDLYAQLHRVEQSIVAGEPGDNIFRKLKTSISDLWNSIFS